MTLTERAAYLRGLADGMKLNERKEDECKLLVSVVELLGDLAANVDANTDSITTMADELDELDDAVDSLEEQLEGLDEDDLDDLDEDMDDDEAGCEYQLDCPECGGPVVLDEATMEQGETNCPNCGAHLTIDIGYEDEDGAEE